MVDTPRKMKYVRLGKSRLKVSKIVLGCMSYGTSDWNPWILDEGESSVNIKNAYDLGITTFDTANMYSNGVSEIVLGKAIKKFNIPRANIVVMTKVYFPVKKVMNNFSPLTEDAYVNQRGLSRRHIFDSIKASLERLQLDYVDVLQCHRFDYETPIGETMQALHDAVQQGLVRYVGMSSSWAYQPTVCNLDYAIANKLTPFHLGIGCIPWSPLARGYLSRPWPTGDDAANKTAREETDRFSGLYKNMSPEITQRVQELAEKKGVSVSQIALAWVMSKDFVTAPIIGVTDIKKLEDSIGAIHVELTPEEVEYLEEKYTPREVYAFQ
ncbi:Aldo/keto reductase [Coprinellus micaceus]|uniref:Aldo/keto reductase n=1 Tax=Coprinellus micaceus TaxID=71717 RepID=A0A4Y7R516_COPMI|nr:Aldo/keto reductase [Coprinellus micaceus]